MSVFDLVIIGSGSGNVVVPDDQPELQTALIEAGTFGGTCINRGCIPSKMLAFTADLADNIREAAHFGVDGAVAGIDWPAIRDRVFTKVDRTSEEGRDGRREAAHVTLFDGPARFTGPHELEVNGTTIEAGQIVIATGGRPSIPRIVAESGVDFHTSDTVMRLEHLPSSMVILGGGSIAAEMAHLFSALGVSVKIISQAPVLLEALDPEISRRFTLQAKTRWGLHLDAEVTHVTATSSAVAMRLADGGLVSGEMLLVATGREPNTDALDLERSQVVRGKDGKIVVDEFGRAAPGIWALGDASSPYELKHVANAEARTIAHNLRYPADLRPLPHDWVPFAIFTDPQIASVGAHSQDLEGRDYVEATQEFSDTAYGWALQDRVGFCKLYADPVAGTLLGAHILGHQASLLITPLIQAIAHGQRVADLARGQYWIHPALSEVVENALLKLPVAREVEP